MTSNEDEPVMNLHLPNGEFTATPKNTSLFTFMGNLASRSHVFLMTSEDEKVMTGSYIFADSPVFDQMFDFMTTQGYPLHLNLREVPQCDEDAYQRYVDQRVASEEIPDYLPEWTDGE